MDGRLSVAGAVLLLSTLATTIDAAPRTQPPTLRYAVPEESPVDHVVADVRADVALADKYSAADLALIRFGFRTPTSNFNVDAATGVVRVARRLDREVLCPRRADAATCEQPIDVVLTPGQYFTIIKVVVDVVDVNDHAPVFPVQRTSLSVGVHASPGALFPIPVAEDDDSGPFGLCRYRLADDFGGKFALKVTDMVDGSQDVRVRLAGRLDDDRRRTYSLVVVAFDGGSPSRSSSMTVVVGVESVDEETLKFQTDHYEATVVENAPINQTIIQVRQTCRLNFAKANIKVMK